MSQELFELLIFLAIFTPLSPFILKFLFSIIDAFSDFLKNPNKNWGEEIINKENNKALDWRFINLDQSKVKVIKLESYSRSCIYRNHEKEKNAADFRDNFIIPELENLKDGEILIIDMDGIFGITISFLDEVFSKLSEKYGAENLKKRIKIKAVQRPALIEKIDKIIDGRYSLK